MATHASPNQPRALRTCIRSSHPSRQATIPAQNMPTYNGKYPNCNPNQLFPAGHTNRIANATNPITTINATTVRTDGNLVAAEIFGTVLRQERYTTYNNSKTSNVSTNHIGPG